MSSMKRASAPSKSSESKLDRRSLRYRLMVVLGGGTYLRSAAIILIVLLLASSAEREVWEQRQEDVARLAARVVAGFLEHSEQGLTFVSLFDADNAVPEEALVSDYLGRGSGIREFVRLDSAGQVLLAVNEDDTTICKGVTIALSRWFQEARRGNFYLSRLRSRLTSCPMWSCLCLLPTGVLRLRGWI